MPIVNPGQTVQIGLGAGQTSITITNPTHQGGAFKFVSNGNPPVTTTKQIGAGNSQTINTNVAGQFTNTGIGILNY